MTAKEYLNQAYWLDRRIDSKLEQLSALKDMATKTTSIMSDDVVSHRKPSRKCVSRSPKWISWV